VFVCLVRARAVSVRAYMYVCRDSAAPPHTRVHAPHTGPRRHARAPVCLVRARGVCVCDL